jgi:hypothetical protein
MNAKVKRYMPSADLTFFKKTYPGTYKTGKINIRAISLILQAYTSLSGIRYYGEF